MRSSKQLDRRPAARRRRGLEAMHCLRGKILVEHVARQAGERGRAGGRSVVSAGRLRILRLYIGSTRGTILAPDAPARRKE
jgi:hypothetical protein